MIIRRTAALAASVLLLTALTLTGCGDNSDDLCAAVDDLQASVDDVTDVQVEEGALATLKDDLEQVKTDAEVVKAEASDQYAEELDLVQKAASSAALAIDFAITSPSAETLADVVPALDLLGERLQDLIDAVASTC